MRMLFRTTPGIRSFFPVSPGVAVESGFRHPVALRACPVFDPAGLLLLRGRGEEPWVLPKMPTMGDLRAFARVELRGTESHDVRSATSTSLPESVRVPLRVVPSITPWRNVTATWISTSQLPLLRRLAYALAHQTIARTEIAVTPRGAFLRCSDGIEAIPLGMFFIEIHPSLFIPAGYDVTPAIAPDVLHRALNIGTSQVVFIDPSARAFALEAGAFVPLETALLEATAWEPLVAEIIEHALDEAPVDLKLEPLGVFPFNQMKPTGTEPPPRLLPK
jgi:hypothetical protein